VTPADLGTSRLSLRHLSDEQSAQLRLLHKTNSAWNWVCALYPATWILAAVGMVLYPTWWVRSIGIIAIGISIQAMAILMHEALHRNLFRRSTLDRWARFLFGIPAFFSGTAYMIAHLNHHRHTRTSLDQDEISNYCRTDFQHKALFYALFGAGAAVYFFIVPWKALSIARPADRRRILFEYTAMLGVYAGAIISGIASGHVAWLLWYWLIPAQLATFLSNIRGIAEHLCTSRGSVVSRTRTTLSNPIVSFLMCNLNFHLEHHLFPGIPWYNLPKAHVLLRDLYRDNDAHIERSYVLHTIRAFRYGPLRDLRGHNPLPGGALERYRVHPC
jgi:fatty acid desaturase